MRPQKVHPLNYETPSTRRGKRSESRLDPSLVIPILIWSLFALAALWMSSLAG